MPSISYNIKYKKNEGLIISPEELLALYFYGVKIQSQDGSEMSNETILTYIKAATQEIENFLGIKILKKFVQEDIDYYNDSYQETMPLIQTSFFVNEALSLTGRIGTSEQIKFPRTWLSTKRSSEELYRKSIRVIPTGSGQHTSGGDVLLTGFFSQIGLMQYRNVPNYFQAQYITGFNRVPFDILNVIGKLAAMGLFGIAGDLILGAGIASMSLGIDGLSQSVSSTSSATNSGYGSRVLQYQKEINESLKRLKLRYKSINLTVL